MDGRWCLGRFKDHKVINGRHKPNRPNSPLKQEEQIKGERVSPILLCSITVERQRNHRWDRLALLVSFLIASPSLIGSIYHPLQPSGSLGKSSQLSGCWGLLTAPHPARAPPCPVLQTHTVMTSVTHSEDQLHLKSPVDETLRFPFCQSIRHNTQSRLYHIYPMFTAEQPLGFKVALL